MVNAYNEGRIDYILNINPNYGPQDVSDYAPGTKEYDEYLKGWNEEKQKDNVVLGHLGILV